MCRVPPSCPFAMLFATRLDPNALRRREAGQLSASGVKRTSAPEAVVTLTSDRPKSALAWKRGFLLQPMFLASSSPPSSSRPLTESSTQRMPPAQAV